jgi:hypothetical protein
LIMKRRCHSRRNRDSKIRKKHLRKRTPVT